MAATWAVLNHLKKSGPTCNGSESKTARLVKTLNDFFEHNGAPIRIQTFASVFYFILPTDQKWATLLYYHLRHKGVHIGDGFPCFLTTAHTDEDLDYVVRAFKESVAEMQAIGFLPEPPPAPRKVNEFDSHSQDETEAGQRASKIPLTDAQKEIWFATQMGDVASCAYNDAVTLSMRGQLDLAAMRAAMRASSNATKRSERPQPAGDYQRATGDVGRNPLIDLTGLAPNEREREVASIQEGRPRSPSTSSTVRCGAPARQT